MPRPTRHVFICAQQRPPGHPRGSCAAKGATALLQAFWAAQQQRQAYDVAITHSGCLGPCDGGANVLVYPDNVLYQGVTNADVDEIFTKHLLGGDVVERLRADAATW